MSTSANPFLFHPARRMRIENLTVLDIAQVRKDPLHQATAHEYATKMKRGVDMGPIWAAKVQPSDKALRALLKGTDLSKPRYVVVSGFHRLAGHKLNGDTHASVVTAELSLVQARYFGAQSNVAHGKRMTHGDHVRYFQFFIDAKQHVLEDGELMSYRDMVKELHGIASRSTLHRWMKEFYPRIAREYTRTEDSPATGGLQREPPTPTEEARVNMTVQSIRGLAAAAMEWQPEERAQVAAEFSRMAVALRLAAQLPKRISKREASGRPEVDPAG